MSILRLVEVEKVILCGKGDDAARVKLIHCDGRMTKITAGDQTLFCSWSSFKKVRRQFEEKFGRPLSDVTDHYEGVVRTQFNYNDFVMMVGRNSAKDTWLNQRIPLAPSVGGILWPQFPRYANGVAESANRLSHPGLYTKD